MLSENAASVVQAYWTDNLGCSPGELFSAPPRIVIHSPQWADYDGVFALFSDGGAIASVPADRADRLRALLSPWSHGESSPESLASALASVAAAVIGPARIGYADAVTPSTCLARALGPDDAEALSALQGACDPTEWAHGGSSLERPCSAVFVGGRIVALAGYAVWGGVLADLFVVTHPAFRGQGFGRNAVAHLARRALAAELLPQYRTLASNRPSVRISEQLGFGLYATSMSVRLSYFP